MTPRGTIGGGPDPSHCREEGAGPVCICLCNALTDADVRRAASQGTRRPAEVFRRCGCAAQCGTCARTVRELLREEARPAPPAPPPAE